MESSAFKQGGVNIPVKLRRSMGMEPRDAIELEVNDRNELVIRATRPAASTAAAGKSILEKWQRGLPCLRRPAGG